MQRALKLNLISPLYYRSQPFSLQEAVERADHAAIGYDAVIECSYCFRDELLSIAEHASGERHGYSEKERKTIESGGTIGRKEEEDMEIPSGSYLFEQLPFIPDRAALERLILPYAASGEGRFYIRIYKESILECVMQLLFPTP